MKKRFLKTIFLCLATGIGFGYAKEGSGPASGSAPRKYYFSASGNDQNDGSLHRPFNSIHKLNSLHLQAGDAVYFRGGERFDGSVFIDSTANGTSVRPIIIGSYGNGKAIISSGNESAFTVYKTRFIHIKDLLFTGSGRKNGNVQDGVIVSNSMHIVVDNLDISGFQKAGLLIFVSAFVTATHVRAHENGFAGISVSGRNRKADCRNIVISHCLAENNPGDPSNLENHSGNGIIAGICKNVRMQYCTATNNGWDMPRIGNGPVGIWCYEADSVVIEHCLSYRNKTAPGAADGGGFDLDGGVTNSVIQYCLSYENEGSGFGIFQYAGASPWHHNTIRFNISENDGLVSAAHAGAFIWNSSRDKSQFNDLLFYNNTIYNSKGAVINYQEESENADFRFYNNIFVGKDSLIFGRETSGQYTGNDWWGLDSGFNIDGIKDFSRWARENGKERVNNKRVGLHLDPMFRAAGKASVTSAEALGHFFNYRLPGNSVLRTAGIDLNKRYHIDTGGYDFLAAPALAKMMGACF